MTNTISVHVPDIGDYNDVEVIEVLVKPGDTICVDQPLITVESDKASMEIPASHAGVVKELLVKLADRVSKGSLLLALEPTGVATVLAAATPVAAADAPARAPVADILPSVPAASAAPSSVLEYAPPRNHQEHASPSVRKYARELGVDLMHLPGTGGNRRILRADVQAFVKGVMSEARAVQPRTPAASASRMGIDVLPWPSLDFSRFGDTELVPLSRVKKISGPNLHRNWVTIPHVTQFEDADITSLEEFRKEANSMLAKSGIKLTMLAFVIKASVLALKKFPTFNSSLDGNGEHLIIKKYYHIGFAADTPQGLVVPVIRNVDQKSIIEIAKEMGTLSGSAREGKLKPGDIQGATFTISSLGGIGSTAFTPIVNAPEVAILGLAKSSFKPVWDGEQFLSRLILPLSLSYDHRVIDGALGARFAAHMAEVLGDMRKAFL